MGRNINKKEGWWGEEEEERGEMEIVEMDEDQRSLSQSQLSWWTAVVVNGGTCCSRIFQRKVTERRLLLWFDRLFSTFFSQFFPLLFPFSLLIIPSLRFCLLKKQTNVSLLSCIFLTPVYQSTTGPAAVVASVLMAVLSNRNLSKKKKKWSCFLIHRKERNHKMLKASLFFYE